MKNVNYIALMKWVILLLPLIVFVQQLLNMPKVRMLKGAFEKHEEPFFSDSTWFSTEFQNEFENYNNQNFGYRSEFVRLANQIKYVAFGEMANPKIREFGNGNLIGAEYIDGYLGVKKTEYHEVKKRCIQLKRMSAYLSEQGKACVVVIAPDKTSYFRDVYKLPLDSEVDSNNYKIWTHFLDVYKVPYIDFRKVFLEAKDTTKYPLFTKPGIHWSTYGGQFAMDSIAGYINSTLQVNGPRMQVSSVRLSNTYTSVEYDIESSLNLMFDLPKEPIGHQIKTFSKGKKLKLLMVSDSFFYQSYNSGFAAELFDNPLFYYYNIKALKFGDPEYPREPRAKQLSDVIENTDVVCLMSVDMNLTDFPWAFSARFENEIINNDTLK